jgi:hypothetical protein
MQLKISRPFPVQIAAGIGAGLLLGAATIWISPVWILVGLAAVACALIVVKKPEIGLLGYLVITSTIIDEGLLPRVSVGVGRLVLTDLILLVLFGVTIVRLLVEKDFKLNPTPLDLPILAFVGLALFASFYAIQQGTLTINQSLGEMRSIVSYLAFFLVTQLIRSKAQVTFFLRGVLYLSLVVAAAMVVQFLVGDAVHILPGRVETVTVQNASYAGITRVLPPGQSLIFFACIALVAVLLTRSIQGQTLTRVAQLGLIGLAIVLTFNRNFWIGVAISLAAMIVLVGYAGRRRLAIFLLLGVVLASLFVPVVEAEPGGKVTGLINAFSARFVSLISGDPLNENSMQFRYVENSYAIPEIGRSPLIGSGLGATYRPTDRRLDWEEYDGRAYIHNGHLWIILKTGFLGYAAFLVMSGVLLWRGLRYWKTISSADLRGVFLAIGLAYVGIFIVAVVNPVFTQLNWAPVFGMLMGINEVILKVGRNPGITPGTGEALVG